MVVYNDSEQRDNLEKMGLSNCRNCKNSWCHTCGKRIKHINVTLYILLYIGTIPGIFTTKEIGEGIASIVDQGTRVDMYITVGETCTRPYSGINRYESFHHIIINPLLMNERSKTPRLKCLLLGVIKNSTFIREFVCEEKSWRLRVLPVYCLKVTPSFEAIFLHLITSLELKEQTASKNLTKSHSHKSRKQIGFMPSQ